MYQLKNIVRHHSEDKPTNTVYANYAICSAFEIDFDLNVVFDWYVKWDTLYVKFNSTDTEYEKFEPDFNGYLAADLKYPDSIEIDFQDRSDRNE